MKIRDGFVSNSSSSSFVIVSKNGELTKEKLMKIFKVKKGDFFYEIADSLAEFFMNTDKTSKDEILDDWGTENISDLPKHLQEAIKSKGIIYRGDSANDSDEPVEVMLVDMDIDYEDEDIIIKKEAGY